MRNHGLPPFFSAIFSLQDHKLTRLCLCHILVYWFEQATEAKAKGETQ